MTFYALTLVSFTAKKTLSNSYLIIVDEQTKDVNIIKTAKNSPNKTEYWI